MVERICRMCQAGNALEAAVCHACGNSFDSSAAPLARRTSATLAARARSSPLLRHPATRSVALGVAALAVEVGAALLNRQRRPSSEALASRPTHSRSYERQRVWEEFDSSGTLRRRVVEHILIRDE